jgi:hypothetical protein
MRINKTRADNAVAGVNRPARGSCSLTDRAYLAVFNGNVGTARRCARAIND